MSETKTVFTELNAVNVNEHTEKKQNLTYLSWAWAWAETKKRYPEATYEVVKFENGLPYSYDSKTGYMVYTKVTIENVTHEMWLPVMDNNNNAMLDHPYEYTTKYGKKTVAACTMFEVNKAIMRCLTKNLAMFGLGLYIYSGEDLPEDDKSTSKPEPAPLSPEAEAERNKEVEDLSLKIEAYNDIIPADKLSKINEAVDAKNIAYLKTILNWCVDHANKKEIA